MSQHSRRLSEPERLIVDKPIREWLKDGIIKENCSDYSSPIVLVNKKDGTKRLCCDFLKLNRKIIKEIYPIPNIEAQINRLQNAKIFTTKDSAIRFFQSEIYFNDYTRWTV